MFLFRADTALFIYFPWALRLESAWKGVLTDFDTAPGPSGRRCTGVGEGGQEEEDFK